MHFLFPRDPLDRSVPEDFFAEQADALASAGFTVSVVGAGDIRRGRALEGIPEAEIVIYRGWMLTGEVYLRLADAIRDAGAVPITTPDEYLAAHHLPNWYLLIRDLTPETRVYPLGADLVHELEALGWGGYFVKDYVKSLKTSGGSFIRHHSEIERVVAELKEFRGEIEGGVCVRRVEEFVEGTETRFFVIKGTAYGPDVSGTVPEIVRSCAERIPSAFFSVDVVRRTDDRLRVVEIGDGQVSDVVGWSATAFAEMWQRAQHNSFDPGA